MLAGCSIGVQRLREFGCLILVEGLPVAELRRRKRPQTIRPSGRLGKDPGLEKFAFVFDAIEPFTELRLTFGGVTISFPTDTWKNGATQCAEFIR